MISFANSLLDGYFLSNCIGKFIIALQFLSSLAMGTVAFGKFRELIFISSGNKRFYNAFHGNKDVLEYYLARRPDNSSGLEQIYKVTCEELLKLLSTESRSALVRNDGIESTSALTAREIKLVKGTCEHVLELEIQALEHTMSIIATVVALAPMFGLLGTVWGVLDAFADMGSAGSANLATIAPAISSALVTTVIGLLIAIPGVCIFNFINSKIRNITLEMEGFAEELMGLIACEFQGRAD